MGDGLLGLLIVVGIFLFGMIVGFILSPDELARARRNYTECVSVGAPPENCLEKYLLPPKEAKP